MEHLFKRFLVKNPLHCCIISVYWQWFSKYQNNNRWYNFFLW